MNSDRLTWPLCAYGRIIRGDESTGEDQVAEACDPEMARRIAACVNACAGIKTCDLEALRGTSILEKANALADKASQIPDEAHQRARSILDIKVTKRQFWLIIAACLGFPLYVMPLTYGLMWAWFRVFG